jgi:hypothetical protein
VIDAAEPASSISHRRCRRADGRLRTPHDPNTHSGTAVAPTQAPAPPKPAAPTAAATTAPPAAAAAPTRVATAALPDLHGQEITFAYIANPGCHQFVERVHVRASPHESRAVTLPVATAGLVQQYGIAWVQ